MYTDDGHTKRTLQECTSHFSTYCKDNRIILDIVYIVAEDTYTCTPTYTPTAKRKYIGYIDSDGTIHIKK